MSGGCSVVPGPLRRVCLAVAAPPASSSVCGKTGKMKEPNGGEQANNFSLAVQSALLQRALIRNEAKKKGVPSDFQLP